MRSIRPSSTHPPPSSSRTIRPSRERSSSSRRSVPSPAIPSLSITELGSGQILGGDANTSIYFEEDPFERDNAGRFRLTLAYRLRSEGLISSFSLGAFGIRDGSERIFLGDRILTPGTDYEIDYDVGQVRLLAPELLFASSPNASVRATWEQRSLFQVSPTQVFGLRTHTALGQSGGIDFLGLYQSERSVVTRPILGTEPGAALLGGLSGSITTELRWMNSVLDAIPGLAYDGQSTLAVNGELAVSLPNPNTRGRTFVDDFDATAQLPVSLLATQWTHGSAPSFRDWIRRRPRRSSGRTPGWWKPPEGTASESMRASSPGPTSTTRSASLVPRRGSLGSD